MLSQFMDLTPKTGEPRYWIQVLPSDENGLSLGIIRSPSLISEEHKHLFLPADGRLLSKTGYPDLYAMIGGNHGETENEFALPDLRE